MIYFTADTHFNHAWMAEWRGFQSLDQMNKMMIEEWNDIVTKHDEIWVLGDFSFGPMKEGLKCFRALKGSKHLIVGNHDSKWVKDMEWSSVHVDHVKRWEGKYSADLYHYPKLTWANAHHGRWHLHGHSHGNLDPRFSNSTRMDVGVDATGQLMVSSDWVVEQMSTRTYDMVDHHGDEKDEK